MVRDIHPRPNSPVQSLLYSVSPDAGGLAADRYLQCLVHMQISQYISTKPHIFLDICVFLSARIRADRYLKSYIDM